MTTKQEVYPDGDDCIRADLVDLSTIVDHVDGAYGRPEALRAYILALRDLQRMHDLSQFDDADAVTGAAIDAAAVVVRTAFEALTLAQRQHEDEETCVAAARRA